MLIERLDQLPCIPTGEGVIIDVETTSWDDQTQALMPYSGHRVAGYALGTLDGERTWYLPVRHHSDVEDGNLPLEPVQRYLRDLMADPTRLYCNHNLKFDLHFMHQDGIQVAGRLEDTQTLARVVEHERFSYKLDMLAKDYLGARKDDRVKAFCRAIKTKDYGRAPARLMGEYAETDVRLTALLRKKLLARLPEESVGVWNTECRLARHLFNAERTGIKIDTGLLAETYLKALKRLLPVLEEIKEIAGWEVNPQSSTDVNRLLIDQLGFKPVAWNYNKEGKVTGPQWSAMILENLPHPVGKLIAEGSHLGHFTSTYCEGWRKRLGDDGRLHPNFKPDGTRSGRLSCSDPNFQNVPVEAEPFVVPDEDRVLVYFDYSQVEYRIFAHYTQSEAIMSAYREDRKADFHQHLANMLGVDRQFAKQLNFSFLYGMGKSTLLKQLAAVLATKGTEDMAHKMRKLLGSGFADRAGLLDTKEHDAVAEALYNRYHHMFPEIRKLSRRVSRMLEHRGWIKNLYGRVYRGISSHKGVNYVVQGTAADLFKEKLCDVCERVACHLGAELNTIVHDSQLWSVPREVAWLFFKDCKREMENVNLRVPLLADGKVSARSWGSMAKVPDVPTCRADLEAKLAESMLIEQRAWGA